MIEGKATMIVKNGELLKENLIIEEVSEQEIMVELRLQSISNIGEIERAYLEPNGKISVFKFPENKQKSGISTFPLES